MEIGKLEYVDVREVWKHEAKDFTLWLADNMNHLGDSLGIGISVLETERDVGSFSVDIYGEDDHGNSLIVENQLEKTDHSHLGQILTYAVGIEAKTIIWISPEPRTEHIEVVQWLNEVTPLDMKWYLVKLDVIRIGHSPVSPLFTKIVGPSNEVKSLGSDKKDLAERHYKRIEFWKLLLNELNKRTSAYKNVSAIKDNWLSAATGVSGVYFSIVIRMDSALVQLVMDKDKEFNKTMFDFLDQHKADIENSFGEQLVWRRMDQQKSSRIQVEIEQVGLGDKSTWEHGVEVIANKFERWEKTFRPFIDKLPKRTYSGYQAIGHKEEANQDSE